ncbi:MAG: UDP-N-acetylglucosamine--LPS N-acetylglucosamine transferase [Planctomycetes bacterium]|nr:UDP-N-acetylglucosamine--LPS N-acetylglucosamine transferase [Planctomycetota bacterium]
MYKRVLILSVNIGGGHVRAFQALREAFRQLGAAGAIRTADAMQCTNKLFRTLFERAYRDVVRRAPDLYGWLYEHFNRVEPGRQRNVLEKLNTRPILKLLSEFQPDLVISTHVLPAVVVSWLREKQRIQTPHAVAVTDFDVHGMWLCDHAEHYFVALEETKRHVEALGIPAEKVSVTGIPIHPVFAQPQEKAEARRQLGLDPDLLTILVTSGSWGLGPMEELVRSLQSLPTPVQVLTICAMNEQFKANIDRIARAGPPDSLVKLACLGWTEQMHVCMSAADLVAGKTGGLTTSEALAKGLPFLIVNPIRGQEERNADHLLEEGAALRCNHLPVLAYKVEKLLNDPQRLARMRANARRLGRPQAAFDIVRKLLQLQPDRSTAVPRQEPVGQRR